MKEFQDKYTSFINNNNISNKEYKTIKDNILDTKKHKYNYKLKYALVIIMLLSIFSIALMNNEVIANKLKHYIIEGSKEEGKASFKSDAIIDKDYDASLLKENTYYKREDIEEKLSLKFLKNKYIQSDTFRVINLENKNNKIAKLTLEAINEKNDNTTCINDACLYATVNTKYSSKPPELEISGSFIYDTYYIKSLETEAIIIKINENVQDGIVEFSYDNISYELIVSPTSDKTIKEVLEGFYK